MTINKYLGLQSPKRYSCTGNKIKTYNYCLWDMMSCSVVAKNQHFGRNNEIHRQSPENDHQTTRYLIPEDSDIHPLHDNISKGDYQ